jgi:hypothetical protein
VRLLAPGDFVADATLAAPARYRLAVQAAGTPASFEFAIRQQAG